MSLDTRAWAPIKTQDLICITDSCKLLNDNHILPFFQGKRQVENPTNTERSTQDKETFNVPIVAGLGGTVVLLMLIVVFLVCQMMR